MFAFAFTLQGRLGRLPFFLRGLALGLAFAVGLVVIVVGLAMTAKDRDWVALVALGLCLLPLIGAALWCSLSLHVRRIRDIGWDPAIVIVAWLLFNVADKLILVHLLPGPASARGAHGGTYLGLALNFALSLALLFWPGRRADDDDRAVAPPSGPITSARPTPSAPVPPRTPRPGTPVQFGRR